MLMPGSCLLQRGRYKYMGQWEGDLEHGEGKCIYADGAQYDGGWQAGMRCVQGPQGLEAAVACTLVWPAGPHSMKSVGASLAPSWNVTGDQLQAIAW